MLGTPAAAAAVHCSIVLQRHSQWGGWGTDLCTGWAETQGVGSASLWEERALCRLLVAELAQLNGHTAMECP